MTNNELPFNDATRRHLEDLLREVVRIADTASMSGVDLLHRTQTFLETNTMPAAHDVEPIGRVLTLIGPNLTHELDAADMTHDLLLVADVEGDTLAD